MFDTVKLVAKLATGELSEEEKRVAWKLITTVGYRFVMIALMAWAYGAGQLFGWGGGFARGDTVEEQIDEAVKPIFDAQKQQASLLKNLTTIVNLQLASSIATEIRLYTGKRCRETDPYERDRLQGEIDRKKDEYRMYRNAEYVFTCGDV